MAVIDLHNHFIAPEIVDFLAREGAHYATRIVERDGRRFFLIQEAALRPIDGPISTPSARLADMELPGERLEDRTWGGSKTNLKHSLSGASAVQDNGPGGNKSPYIPNH